VIDAKQRDMNMEKELKNDKKEEKGL